ncbi:hypothetical protein CF161_03708 [Pseudomonas sp. CF161]|nr:hypothetical protein CF161_03708 [Pseudomonas sp. CF161]
MAEQGEYLALYMQNGRDTTLRELTEQLLTHLTDGLGCISQTQTQ